MKKSKKILAAILALLILVSVSVQLPLPETADRDNSSELPPASVSILYREAEKILVCTCIRTTEEEEEPTVSRFSVDSVLDGAAEAGQTFELNEHAELGAEYLVYLAKPSEQPEEGGSAERLVTELIPIENGRIFYRGETCSIESVERDIKIQRKILTVPSQSFFYDSFERLVTARVLSVSEPIETQCRSVDGGESTLSTQEQMFASISVLNGLYGELKCGEKLKVVISPYNARPVINETDLTTKTVEAPPTTGPKEGSVYIFFLLRSEDAKSDYYFTVNPYEGYVLFVGNTITRPYYNDAIRDINDIKRFSVKLKEVFMPEPEGE